MSKDKMVYGVIILRTSGDHIQAAESSDYNKCYERWKILQQEWTSASKEQRPFVLEDPVVTAFSPSMIYEIKLIPVMTEQMASNSHNPYQKNMNQNGFSSTFPGGSGIDLLSR